MNGEEEKPLTNRDEVEEICPKASLEKMKTKNKSIIRQRSESKDADKSVSKSASRRASQEDLVLDEKKKEAKRVSFSEPKPKIQYKNGKASSWLALSPAAALGTAGGIVGGVLGFIFAGPAFVAAGIGAGAAAWVGGTVFGAAGVVSGQQTGKLVFGNTEFSIESYEPLSKLLSSIAVFSDIDETLTCRHDPFYAKHGALYPGIVEFLIGLSRGQKNMEPRPINFLSARAGDTVPFVRLTADHPIVQTVLGSGGEVGTFLYGHVQDQLMRVFGKHSRWAALGRTKVRNLIKYMKEKPANLKAIFVGDDTEGDLMAGIYLLRNCPEVSAVFIHKVKQKRYRIQEKFARDPRLKRLFFYYTTAEAAMLGYSEGLLSLLSLMNIYNAVGRSAVSKEYRNSGTGTAKIYNQRMRFENDFKALEDLIVNEQKINEDLHASLLEHEEAQRLSSAEGDKDAKYCKPQEPQNMAQLNKYLKSFDEPKGKALLELGICGEDVARQADTDEEKVDLAAEKFQSVNLTLPREKTSQAQESIWTHTELKNYLQEHSISVSNDGSEGDMDQDTILLELDDFARMVKLEDELELKEKVEQYKKQEESLSQEKEKSL